MCANAQVSRHRRTHRSALGANTHPVFAPHARWRSHRLRHPRMEPQPRSSPGRGEHDRLLVLRMCLEKWKPDLCVFLIGNAALRAHARPCAHFKRRGRTIKATLASGPWSMPSRSRAVPSSAAVADASMTTTTARPDWRSSFTVSLAAWRMSVYDTGWPCSFCGGKRPQRGGAHVSTRLGRDDATKERTAARQAGDRASALPAGTLGPAPRIRVVGGRRSRLGATPTALGTARGRTSL